MDIYRNTGTSFELMQSLPGTYLGSADWGDYDNDGDLDVVLTGCLDKNCENLSTIVYNNRGTVGNDQATNTAPTVPTGLSYVQNERTLTFTWGTATDTETPDEGLRYNLYVGLAGDESSAYSPEAIISGTNVGWQLEPGLQHLFYTTT